MNGCQAPWARSHFSSLNGSKPYLSHHRLQTFSKDLRTALAAAFHVEDVPGNAIDAPIFISAIYNVSRDNRDPQMEQFVPSEAVSIIDTHNSSDLVIIEFDADIPVSLIGLQYTPLTYWTLSCHDCVTDAVQETQVCGVCVSKTLFSAFFVDMYLPHCVSKTLLNCMAGSRIDAFSPPPSIPQPPSPPTPKPPTPKPPPTNNTNSPTEPPGTANSQTISIYIQNIDYLYYIMERSPYTTCGNLLSNLPKVGQVSYRQGRTSLL